MLLRSESLTVATILLVTRLKRPEMARESARLITERPSLGVFSVAPPCRGGTRRSRIRLGAFASSGAAKLQGQRR